ncbi:SEL1-like repeat protein [Sphingobium sp. HBC34]|uniref:SEL1-like repeat protein n=1 Tax=Sphingobium cyanobacteriorum TaxID=3063954 RepID=A0ABT8ZSI4_9SPHN|nr:SEL1-like repeat protein [Sphingobium sp. HBC34]MDO7837499.1 SEL1-like repeat protein [Sphingobium sp. HBC34]
MQKLAYSKSLAMVGSGVRFLSIGLLALASVSCAAPNRYMGIYLRSSATEPALQALASRARTGDKQARFDLGNWFERGWGLPTDLDRAQHLYRLAAADMGGTIFIYQPPTHKGGTGHVIAVDTGPVLEGLPEAKSRLTDAAAARGSPTLPPAAAVIEAAYVRWANWACKQMVDVCPDDALVFPVNVRAEKIECDVEIGSHRMRFRPFVLRQGSAMPSYVYAGTPFGRQILDCRGRTKLAEQVQAGDHMPR